MQVSSLPARSRDFHVLSPAADSTFFCNWSADGEHFSLIHRKVFVSWQRLRRVSHTPLQSLEGLSMSLSYPHTCAHTSKQTVPWTGLLQHHWLRIIPGSGFSQASDRPTLNPHHYLILWFSTVPPKGAIWKFAVAAFWVLTIIRSTVGCSEHGQWRPVILQCLGQACAMDYPPGWFIKAPLNFIEMKNFHTFIHMWTKCLPCANHSFRGSGWMKFSALWSL